MIELHPNLYVGSEEDEQLIRTQEGWFVIHACKEPYHRNAMGYSGRAAPKTHPEYLIARRDGRLILNLVDAPNVAFIGAELIDVAVMAIRDNIEEKRILVHCNHGASRSPTIALLYLIGHTNRFDALDYAASLAAFQQIYPPYNPGRGMADFARINWERYRRSPS